MADVLERIYELTSEPNPDGSVNIILDSPDWDEMKTCTKDEFLADEVTAREDMDDAIKVGSGLETDGSLTPFPASNYLKNVNFTSAGLDVSLKNMCLLLDTELNRQYSMVDMSIKVSFTANEILNLFSTPIQKITQPTLGTFYDVRRIFVTLNFNKNAFVGAGDMEIYYTGGFTIATISNSFLTSITSKTISVILNDIEYEILTNTGLSFRITGADLTVGDSSIDVTIDYRMRDLTNISSLSPTSCCLTPVTDTFTDADLTVSDNLVINHNLNTTNIFVVVKDNTGAFVAVTFTLGDEGGLDTYNKITIPIGGPITGTWDYMVVGKQT